MREKTFLSLRPSSAAGKERESVTLAMICSHVRGKRVEESAFMMAGLSGKRARKSAQESREERRTGKLAE